MREGVLVYDHESGRMDIRFDLLDYYGGLHCGEKLEVKIGDVWVPTRIELGDFWYLCIYFWDFWTSCNGCKRCGPCNFNCPNY